MIFISAAKVVAQTHIFRTFSPYFYNDDEDTQTDEARAAELQLGQGPGSEKHPKGSRGSHEKAKAVRMRKGRQRELKGS